jgi:hypothetical protein
MRNNNPITTLDPTRRSRDAADFEDTLRRKIVGQEQAVERVAEIYQSWPDSTRLHVRLEICFSSDPLGPGKHA